MRANQLIAIAVAAALLLGGVAALGAASPADQANDDGADAREANSPGDERGVGGADEAADDAPEIGPSDGLPERVPDRVSEIHDRIESFLGGSIDHLGHALSELLGDGADDERSGGPAGDASTHDGTDERDSDG